MLQSEEGVFSNICVVMKNSDVYANIEKSGPQYFISIGVLGEWTDAEKAKIEQRIRPNYWDNTEEVYYMSSTHKTLALAVTRARKLLANLDKVLPGFVCEYEIAHDKFRIIVFDNSYRQLRVTYNFERDRYIQDYMAQLEAAKLLMRQPIFDNGGFSLQMTRRAARKFEESFQHLADLCLATIS